MRISDWSSDVCSSDLALSIGIVAALSSPAVGQGQRQCASHESALRQLALKYGEAVVAGGVVNGGTFLELLASPNGETWTTLEILPNGRACIPGSGEKRRGVTPAPAGGRGRMAGGAEARKTAGPPHPKGAAHEEKEQNGREG